MRLAQRRGHDQLGHLPAHDRVACVAEDALGRRVELDDRAVVVDRDDAVERRVQHRARAGVARSQRGLALLALGDVEDVALHAQGLAGLVAHEHALVAHPGHAAIAPQQPVLAARRSPVLSMCAVSRRRARDRRGAGCCRKKSGLDAQSSGVYPRTSVVCGLM